MKAIVISEFGGPEVLKLEERANPILKSDEVLIRVFYSGLNRPDIFQRKGKYPAPDSVAADIPGLEVSGTVEAVGEEVSNWKVGDQVCALLAGAGYSSYVAVPQGQCLMVPNGYSLAEAAALPETLFTVWTNVFQQGGLKAGETILIHGGSGGIGSTAIQLAKLWGARVLTTAGSAEKCAYCLKIGADLAVNYREEDFDEVLKKEKIQLILDSIGGKYFAKNMNILHPEGRLIYINAMEGAKVELNILQLMQKRIHIYGSTLRSREVAFKTQVRDAIQQEVWPIIRPHNFQAQIFKIFDYSEVQEAHSLMENGQFMGKILLKWT